MRGHLPSSLSSFAVPGYFLLVCTIALTCVPFHRSDAATINIMEDYARFSVSGSIGTPTDPYYRYRADGYQGSAIYSDPAFSTTRNVSLNINDIPRTFEIGEGTLSSYGGVYANNYGAGTPTDHGQMTYSLRTEMVVYNEDFRVFNSTTGQDDFLPSNASALFNVKTRFVVSGDGAHLSMESISNDYRTASEFALYDQTLGAELVHLSNLTGQDMERQFVDLQDGHMYTLYATDSIDVFGHSGSAGGNLQFSFYDTAIVKIPEPGTLVMLASGVAAVLGCAGLRTKKRRRDRAV